MKLHHIREGDRLQITIRGEVDSDRCDCLDHFLDHVEGTGWSKVTIDLHAVSAVDEQALVLFVERVQNWIQEGAAVRITDVPNELYDRLRSLLPQSERLVVSS